MAITPNDNQEKKSKEFTRRDFLKAAGGTMALAAALPTFSLTAQGQENVAKKTAMKRIDFENHFYEQSLFDTMQKRATPPYYRADTDMIKWADNISDSLGHFKPILLDMGESRLKIMDEVGIDLAVLSYSTGAEILDAQESIEVCRNANNKLFEATKKYPKRFMGSAILPVKNVGAACLELERCVKELGFVGWQTHSNYGTDAAPDNEVFRPIFRKAASLGAYVYLHPFFPQQERFQGYGAALYGATLGFTVDTAITTMRMIFSGLFDELPELTVLLGHLGEAFPFLLERIDNRTAMYQNPSLKNKHNPSYYFKNNILVTTSGNMSQEAFYCTRNVLGIDRILFGSDYPYEVVKDMVSFVDNIPLPEHEREAVYYKNAAEKLNIKLP